MSMSRKLLILALAIAALLMMLVALLPTIIGSRWVAQPLIARLRADDFQLRIDSVRLRWLTPLQLSGIHLQQHNGPELLSIKEIRSDRSLLGFLFNRNDLGHFEIVKPTVDIELIADESNLGRLIRAVKEQTSPSPNNAGPRRALNVSIDVSEFSAKVQRGQDEAPLVIIPAFDVAMQYQATSDSANITIGETEILKQVELTPELMQFGLAFALPPLAQSAWFDGQISLAIDDTSIDLDKPELSSGRTIITLHQVRSGPTQPQIIELLEFWARLRKQEPLREIVFVDGSQIEIEVADTKVTHRGLQFGLPRFDPRFQLSTSGSVGLQDRGLDLIVNIPVPLEQLAFRESVQALGVPTISLPIGGTLDRPKIDWSAMRNQSSALLDQIKQIVIKDSPTTAAVVGAIESISNGDADKAIGMATEFAQQWLKTRRQRSDDVERRIESENQQPENQQPENQPAENQPADGTRGPVRGFFRELLRPKPERNN